jgi:hypothetical protein
MPLMVQTKATDRSGLHELMAFVRSEIPTTSEEEVLSFVAQELGMTLLELKLAMADECSLQIHQASKNLLALILLRQENVALAKALRRIRATVDKAVFD